MTRTPAPVHPETFDDGGATDGGSIALGLALVGVVTFAWGAVSGGLLVWLLT